VVHQTGVQTQGLPTVCCLCTTQIIRAATSRPLPRCRVCPKPVPAPWSLGPGTVAHPRNHSRDGGGPSPAMP
jgi:hypothetical protein